MTEPDEAMRDLLYAAAVLRAQADILPVPSHARSLADKVETAAAVIRPHLAAAVSEPVDEDKCSQCGGLFGDLEPGREPEELCETCYGHAVENLTASQADRARIEALTVENARLRDADRLSLETAEGQRIIHLADGRGDFVTGEDGFVCWWPKTIHGALSAWEMRLLAAEMDGRNQPWVEQINAYNADPDFASLQERNDALALQADEWEGKYQIVSDLNANLQGRIEALTARVAELEGVLAETQDFVEDATKRWPVGSLEAENAWAVWHRARATLTKEQADGK